MINIKEFIVTFIETEKKIELFFRQRNLEAHNILVDKVNNDMCGEDMVLASKESEPLSMIDEMVLEENANLPVASRHLFKISEYSNDKYGTVWACYVSNANPLVGETKTIAFCYLAAKIDGDLKLIAEYGFNDDDIGKWEFYGGDENVKMKSIGAFKNTERLLEPVNDHLGLEQYLKNI